MVPGWLQIALVVLLAVLLFGRGRIAGLMGDFAHGIKSFKHKLKDESASKADLNVSEKTDPKTKV